MQNQNTENWNALELREIAEMTYGKMPKKDRKREEGFPIFSGYRITGYYEQPMYRDPMLIVVARGVGGTGDVKISPPNSWITNLSIVLQLKEHLVDKYFLKYKLNVSNLRELDSGSAQSQITIGNLENYRITIPPLQTQKKIADILSTYDELIENNTRRIKILEEIAQAIYKEWFVHFRFPGHEKVKMIDSKTEFGKIPEGWEVQSLSEFASVNRGLSYKREHMQKNGIPLLTMGVVSPVNRFNYLNLKYYDKAQFSKKYQLNPGDLVVCSHDVTQERAILGCPAIVPKDLSVPIMMGTNLYGVRIDYEKLKLFVYFEMKSSRYREYMMRRAKGTNVLYINKTDVEDYQLLNPKMAVLDSFFEILNSINKEVEELIILNRKLEQARDLLLPKLVTGEMQC